MTNGPLAVRLNCSRRTLLLAAAWMALLATITFAQTAVSPATAVAPTPPAAAPTPPAAAPAATAAPAAGTAAPAAATQPAATPAASDLTFDVASVRPSAPLDQAKVYADLQAGKEFKYGAHIDGLRAQYSYMLLKELIANAYGLKPFQVSGPDWLNGMDAQRFEIVANMLEGSTKDDAPKMLQALLAERFKLVARRVTQEHPVYALVVAKGGPKLKESTEKPVAIDPDAPLAKGEMKINGPDGPVRVTQHPDGSSTTNMGVKGIYTHRVQSGNLHFEATILTMPGLAEILTSAMSGTGRTVVDMTGLKGNYQVTLDLSMAELMASARAQGANLGPMGVGTGANEASDPGDSSVMSSLEKLGLKLESRKVNVEQVVVDHVEKTPTEN